MDFIIKSAERTKNQMAVVLALINGMTLIVGNGIVDKILKADDITFDFFRPLCAAGGYLLQVEGKMVEHKAGDAYGEDSEYKVSGYHIESAEDVYPSIQQSDKYFDLKVKIPKHVHCTATLAESIGGTVTRVTPPVQTDDLPEPTVEEVVDTTTGEVTEEQV